MTERIAACACGQLTIACVGAPVRVSMCHCLNCQRRSGSVFAVQARFAHENVTISGEAKTFNLKGDSGGTATFRFCPNCGGTVCYELDSEPALIAVPVGAFADPTFPAPNYSVYEERAHPWALCAADGAGERFP
jgi:hypothetical protein